MLENEILLSLFACVLENDEGVWSHAGRVGPPDWPGTCAGHPESRSACHVLCFPAKQSLQNSRGFIKGKSIFNFLSQHFILFDRCLHLHAVKKTWMHMWQLFASLVILSFAEQSNKSGYKMCSNYPWIFLVQYKTIIKQLEGFWSNGNALARRAEDQSGPGINCHYLPKFRLSLSFAMWVW